MDINKYIESGVLELYVLGQLPQAEMLEVEQLCATYPAIAAERLAIEDVFINLALEDAPQAPAFNKTHIIAAATATVTESTTTPPVANNITVSYNKWRTIAAAASVAALIAIGGLVYTINKQAALNNTITSINTQVQQQQQELSIVKNTNYKPILLNSTDSTKQLNATVYYAANSQEVYINWSAAPTLTKEQQYQLWAIVDGKPVDAGVFNEKTELQKMKSIKGAVAFAVTIEKAGGSIAPTLDKMVVLGKI